MIEKEKAILIGVNINNQADFLDSMEELESLAEACELESVATVEQNLKAINKKYYIGTGKVEEVLPLIDETGAEVLVFNNELSPSQLRNLEKKFERPIMDRTSLILEIFAGRAKTRESKLQVQVAKLQYFLPRLIGSYESLGRQTGGVGTKTRGAGEKKLELDRRKIESKIFELNKELESIRHERQTQRKLRGKAELPTVALVGYTNAGKSTLMNAMVELYKKDEAKKVLEKDMLFATLETTVRSITLTDNKTFLLSDTVGFISKLPHNLVKAFRSTLEEVREADLLLHVVDYSNPSYDQQIKVTNETLKQIGAEAIPIIYVYNKVDLTTFNIPFVKDDQVYISAKKKIGIDELIQLISKNVFQRYIHCQMLIPYDKGDIVSYLNEKADVQSVCYESNGTLLTMECRESDYKRFEQFVTVNNLHLS